MTFGETCPPTGDPVLDDPGVSSTLNLEWSRSKGENLERGGWIYQDDATGEYVVTVDNGTRRDRRGIDPSSPTIWRLLAPVQAQMGHGTKRSQPERRSCCRGVD